MNPLQQDFHRLRCAGTPWCLILTPDYRECMRSLCKMVVEQDEPPSLWAWDCLQGHRCLSEVSLTAILGSPDDTVQAPALLLKKALELPANSVLFFIVPKNDMVEDAAVIQGIANLRNEFKATRRTLVILARDAALPPFLADDVPLLRDPLPGPDEIKGVFKRVLAPFRENTVYQTATEQVDKVADLCRGLTRFAAEEAIARNLTKNGMDLEGLSQIQREIVETATGRGLVYERGRTTFDDIGGQQSFKRFLQAMFNGPRRPRLIVRWDEIEKSVSSAASGASADNTGVSQDMHHSYVWEPDSAVTKARLAAGEMPELHVWAAIPALREIIDMTTRYWPEQCLLIQGLGWPGNKPPTYFWGIADELPDGVIYAPDINAIALALHLLKGDLP